MNIKLPIAFFLALLVTECGKAQQINCKDYKTGKFILTDSLDNRKYTVERNDSIQMENDLATGSKSKYRVTWISDCEYNPQILEGSEKLMNFYSGKTLIIRIVETYDNGYKFEGSFEGIDRKFTQVLRKVNQ